MSYPVTMVFFVLFAFSGSMAATSWNYKDEMAQVCWIRFNILFIIKTYTYLRSQTTGVWTPACCLFNKFDLNLLGLPGQNEKHARGLATAPNRLMPDFTAN